MILPRSLATVSFRFIEFWINRIEKRNQKILGCAFLDFFFAYVLFQKKVSSKESKGKPPLVCFPSSSFAEIHPFVALGDHLNDMATHKPMLGSFFAYLLFFRERKVSKRKQNKKYFLRSHILCEKFKLSPIYKTAEGTRFCPFGVIVSTKKAPVGYL